MALAVQNPQHTRVVLTNGHADAVWNTIAPTFNLPVVLYHPERTVWILLPNDWYEQR